MPAGSLPRPPWSKRDLSAKRYVYFWVDGIHVQARLEEAAQCLLVIIGATPEGKKELVGLVDGVRESAQSWKELLLDLKRGGLRWDPRGRRRHPRLLAGGRGGVAEDARPALLGAQDRQCLEQAAQQPAIEGQACAPGDLDGRDQEGCTRRIGRLAVECLIKDRDALLAFYDFSAEHWKHLRTTNPIESSFAMEFGIKTPDVGIVKRFFSVCARATAVRPTCFNYRTILLSYVRGGTCVVTNFTAPVTFE